MSCSLYISLINGDSVSKFILFRTQNIALYIWILILDFTWLFVRLNNIFISYHFFGANTKKILKL